MSEPPPAHWPKPYFAPIWLACAGCGHWWDGDQPQCVPFATFAAHMKSHRCPKCGAGTRKLLLRTKPNWPKPYFAPIWLACAGCGHWWDGDQPQCVPFATFAAHMKSHRCPKCGAGTRKLLLRTKPLSERPHPE